MVRKAKNSEDRKDELLQIGIRVFLEGGTKHVSIQKVVQEAGVATGLFYYYFKSKEDFIEQAIAQYIENYVADLEQTVSNKNTSVLNRLYSLMEQFKIRFCEANEIINDELLQTPQHLALEGYIVQRLHPIITDFLEEGNQNGSFNISVPDVTALFLVCGMIGILQRAQFADSNCVYSEARRLVFTILSITEEEK